jgi:ribonuclease HI
MERYAARPDLTNQSLDNPDLELYTNGSLFVRNGIRYARFVIVMEFGTLQSGPFPFNTSSQLAELVALTKALELSKDRRVNTYTVSKCAFITSMLMQPFGKKDGL